MKKSNQTNWNEIGPVLLKALEKYVNHTISIYGHSRMFDCGVEEAEKIIKKCRKIK